MKHQFPFCSFWSTSMALDSVVALFQTHKPYQASLAIITKRLKISLHLLRFLCSLMISVSQLQRNHIKLEHVIDRYVIFL